MDLDDGFDLAHEVASTATVQRAELTARLRSALEFTAQMTRELAEARGHVRTLRLSVANVNDTLDAVRHELADGEAGEDVSDAGRDATWCVEQIEAARARLNDALAHTKPVPGAA
jgi:uncharacterized protein Yka (UPF0111/DUF47 family)